MKAPALTKVSSVYHQAPKRDINQNRSPVATFDELNRENDSGPNAAAANLGKMQGDILKPLTIYCLVAIYCHQLHSIKQFAKVSESVINTIYWVEEIQFGHYL